MIEITKNKDNIQDSEINETVIRVKALIINSNNCILLGHSHCEYQFPGGHVLENEGLLYALKRELKEELGIEIFDLKLINVSENFFEWMGKYQHEMLFVYNVDLDNNYEITQKDNFKCLDSDEIFKWHKIKTFYIYTKIM